MKKLISAAILLATAITGIASPTASNDPTGQYRDGMFLLPELEGSDDSYLVVVQPTTGEPKSFALPQGSTGLRVSKSALPSGEWTWYFKRSSQKLPELELVTGKVLDLGAADVKEGRFSLVWRRVEGASRYVVSGKVRTAGSIEAEGSKLEVSCFASVCTNGDVATTAIELKPGSEVTWQVTALDKDSIPLKKSEVAHIQMEDTFIRRASNAGFKVQRSDTLSKTAAGLPAIFSYLSSQAANETSRSTAYQSEFALIYDSPTPWKGLWPRVSLEGRLTSRGEQKPSDQLRFRAGFYSVAALNQSGGFTDVVTGLKYETERKTGTKKGLLELGLTPVYGPLGRSWPGPPSRAQADAAGNYTKLPWVQITPLVSFGAEVGKAMEVGTSAERQNTILRLRTTVRLDGELNALSNMLGTRNATAFVEGTYWRLPREEDVRNYRVGKTGLSFGLTEALSFDLAYTVGREAPAFRFNRFGSAGFGLKF
jgi:hypothetical protein